MSQKSRRLCKSCQKITQIMLDLLEKERKVAYIIEKEKVKIIGLIKKAR
jgi:hypothetical protein